MATVFIMNASQRHLHKVIVNVIALSSLTAFHHTSFYIYSVLQLLHAMSILKGL